MNLQDITSLRQANQHISTTKFTNPKDVVACLGAIQAQDYLSAKWAIGLRLINGTDPVIEQAFNNGTILRTHILRPTWHFVTPEDIQWMLTLTSPRIKAFCTHYNRKLELDDNLFKKSNTVIMTALQGSKYLSRTELASKLEGAGIIAKGIRLVFILLRAELDGIICSGARREKQFTYALFEERVPKTKIIAHEEAITKLTNRYFSSHGPATLQDFIWWSGLTAIEAKSGLEMAKPNLLHETIDDKTYWFSSSNTSMNEVSQSVYLLPNYDEYIVGYTDRRAIYDIGHNSKLDARGNVLFQHTIVLGGRVIGTWKRVLEKKSIAVEVNLFSHLKSAETELLKDALGKYEKFIKIPIIFTSGAE